MNFINLPESSQHSALSQQHPFTAMDAKGAKEEQIQTHLGEASCLAEC
jgi:hypothetical protein